MFLKQKNPIPSELNIFSCLFNSNIYILGRVSGQDIYSTALALHLA